MTMNLYTKLMDYVRFIANFDRMGKPLVIPEYQALADDIKLCSQVFKNGIQVGNIGKCENYCSSFSLTKNSPNFEGNLRFLTMAHKQIADYITQYKLEEGDRVTIERVLEEQKPKEEKEGQQN